MKLKDIHLQAAAHLLSGKTIRECERLLGVSNSTLWRWRQDEGFKAECERLRRSVTGELKARCDGAGDKALDAILTILDDPEATRTEILRAATTILERCGIRKEPVAVEQAPEVAPKTGESVDDYMARLTEAASAQREAN